MSCQAKLLFLAMAAMLSIRTAAARNRAAGSAPARFDKFDSRVDARVVGFRTDMSTPSFDEAFYTRIWNEGDLAAATDLFSKEFCFHGSPDCISSGLNQCFVRTAVRSGEITSNVKETLMARQKE